MNDLFFTADEHYDHATTLRADHCARPFAFVEEMKEEMIARHNAKVSKTALVWHLGDMFWRTCSIDIAYQIMDRLNGRHHYVYGNHEEIFEHYPAFRDQFDSINSYKEIKYQHQKIILFHYAMRVWHGSDFANRPGKRPSWHLYGHSHGALPPHGLSSPAWSRRATPGNSPSP